jgi:hypothetical protein
MRLLKAGLFLLIALQMIVIVPSSSAQRLYDKRRDEQAQDAKEYIEPLLSGAVFDAQLKNLALLSKQDLEALLLGSRYKMRSTVNRFIEWRDVNCYVAEVKARVQKTGTQPTPAEQAALIQNLKNRIEAAKKELEKLKAEAACKKDPTENFAKCLPPEQAAACEKLLDPKPKSCLEPDATATESFFEGVNELDELLKLVQSLETKAVSPNVIKAGGKVKEALDQIEVVFKNHQERMKKYNQLQGQLMDLRILLKQVALQTLQVEAEHYKNIAEINTRRELQEAEAENLISEYEDLAEQLDLGYEADSMSFLPAVERGSANFCTEIGLPPQPERNVEMTLRDGVRQARNAETALSEAEESLQQARRELAEAPALAREEEEHLMQAVRAARGATARRRAQHALTQARQNFSEHQRALEAAISNAQQNIITAKKSVLETRNALADRIEALHIATSLASYGELPSRVADQRLAQEEHAYSIRLSRVRARAYQLTVSTGVQRLALYHKGGIKPTLVARLVHAASTVAIPPILATN